MIVSRRAGSRLLGVIALIGALGCQAHSRPAPPSAAPPSLPDALATDPVLTAMLAELDRSTATLRLDEYEAPYFISYTVHEDRNVHIAGKLGAIFVEDTTHRRRANVDVRVGDYVFDSSEDIERDWLQENVYEPSDVLPIDDDPRALRHALWLLSDLRYKQALSSYLKLKGQRVYKVKDPTRRPSFTAADPVVRADPAVPLTVDTARWRAVVKQVGDIIADEPAIFDAEVNVDFSIGTRWMVTSEGARMRTVAPMYALSASGYIRASDGMLLDHSADFYAPTEAGLPDDATIVARARRLVTELRALAAAPLLDPYTGPAIFEPAATGVFFHEVLGHRLEGHRQDDDSEGKTFAAHLNQPILPAFLSVHDDPTRRDQGDIPLNGFYVIDDEGVVARRVTLVDRGVLKAFLQSRRPTAGFHHSNGHGRAQSVRRPVPRMGNLIVEAHQTVPHSELKDMLLAEVRKQGKPFGLIIRDIAGGSTNTSSYGYQAFKGEARMVYRVDTKTGAETLVRGVEIVGTPLVTIDKIVAAGDRIGVFNGYCGAESGMVPVSTVAPATLFSEIELQRSGKPRAKGPILDPPRSTAP